MPEQCITLYGCDVIIRDLLYLVPTGSMMGETSKETFGRWESDDEPLRISGSPDGAGGCRDDAAGGRCTHSRRGDRRLDTLAPGGMEAPVCAQHQAHRRVGRGQL